MPAARPGRRIEARDSNDVGVSDIAAGALAQEYLSSIQLEFLRRASKASGRTAPQSADRFD